MDVFTNYYQRIKEVQVDQLISAFRLLENNTVIIETLSPKGILNLLQWVQIQEDV